MSSFIYFLHFKRLVLFPLKFLLFPSILSIASRPSYHKTFLVLNSNSEIGSYLLYKATGIFTNFSIFLFGYFKGLKLKQFLKKLNRKNNNNKVSSRGPNWAESGQLATVRPQPREAKPAQPGSTQAASSPAALPPFVFSSIFFRHAGPAC
jgi:hypothetical protein